VEDQKWPGRNDCRDAERGHDRTDKTANKTKAWPAVDDYEDEDEEAKPRVPVMADDSEGLQKKLYKPKPSCQEGPISNNISIITKDLRRVELIISVHLL